MKSFGLAARFRVIDAVPKSEVDALSQPCLLALAEDGRVIGFSGAGIWRLQRKNGEWKMVPIPNALKMVYPEDPALIVLYDPESEEGVVMWDASRDREPAKFGHDAALWRLETAVRAPFAPGGKIAAQWGAG